jgi:RNA polymerase sigma-70 factor, ECF subfamily
MSSTESVALRLAPAALAADRLRARCYTAAAVAPSPPPTRAERAATSAGDDADATVSRERELLARLRAGDPEALGELYDLHGARVHAVAARVDRDSAEDVTHEVFLKLWRHGARFDGRARLATWLYRLTLNAALDHQRRRRVRAAAGLDSITEAPSVADDGGDPSRLDLAVALAELPTRLRWPIMLRFYAGLDYAEIARTLGCREGTVASRLSRALARLGARLGAPGSKERA